MDSKRNPSRGKTPTAAVRTGRRSKFVGARHVDTQIKELLQQLQLHQAELETQNEELRRVQAELAATLARYTELYEQAPVGYLTLDARLRITQLNRAAATLLGIPVDAPLPIPLSRFLLRGALAEWQARIASAAGNARPTSFELQIRPVGAGQLLNVHVDVAADKDSKSTRVALADVSELRALELAAQNAALMEHERISADIHDGLGQELAGLSLLLRALRTKTQSGQPATAAEFEQLNEIATQAIASCRSIVRGLSPVGENEGGLLTALQSLVERVNATGGAPVQFETTGRAEVCVPLGTADHLFRIAQEGLTNARKHSDANHIKLSLDVQRSAITLQVFDDGKGCGARAGATQGFGLRLMGFRASSIHANLTIDDAPTGGTRLRCVCPQPEANA
jgi:signal transduction histidine kinase